MDPEQILSLDPVIHAPNRLAILSILVMVEQSDFAFLKESAGLSDGNLSTHLARLEAEGYIVIRKTFNGKKPHTTCAMTEKGRQSFRHYIELMETIIGKLANPGSAEEGTVFVGEGEKPAV